MDSHGTGPSFAYDRINKVDEAQSVKDKIHAVRVLPRPLIYRDDLPKRKLLPLRRRPENRILRRTFRKAPESICEINQRHRRLAAFVKMLED